MIKLAKILLFSLSLILVACSDNSDQSSEVNKSEQLLDDLLLRWGAAPVLMNLSRQLLKRQ